MFEGKTIVLGVCGGIAAFKAAQLASDLVKTAADVHVIMTKNATQFITPLTFETLTGNRVSVDTFDRNFEYDVNHIALAQKADVFLVAPATANVIAKIANGLADDMLTTTFLASRCQKIVAPAMNTGMYDNTVTRRNLQLLQSYGIKVIDPETGYLACGSVGRGKLPSIKVLFEEVHRALTDRDLEGLRVLVTAGPTQEAIDPVRFISNHSTGKMGYAVAAQARRRGAQVTLVSGRTALTPPQDVDFVQVASAQDMYDAVLSRFPDQQIVVKCAAVADFRPREVSEEKLKKSSAGMTLQLERTQDILMHIGSEANPAQVICGFAMETHDLLENARKKLVKKNVDMIVANSLTEKGAGFGASTNRVVLLTQEDEENLPLMPKEEVADEILNRLLVKYQEKQERIKEQDESENSPAQK